MRPQAPPNIPLELLPEGEREAVTWALELLSESSKYIDSARAALLLFDHVTHAERSLTPEQRREMGLMISEWPAMAAREFVMSIYDFAGSRQGINRALSKCPTLQGIISSQIRHANLEFKKHFSEIENLRHAGSHKGESKNHPGGVKQQEMASAQTLGPMTVLKGGYAGTVFIGNRYISTWHGKLYSCEISESTLEKLITVRDAFYDSFFHACGELIATSAQLSEN